MPVQIIQKGNIEKTLLNMPILLRQKSLKKGLRKGGNEMAKAMRPLIPPPGYPGDKPGLMPLNKTVRVVVREYDGAVVAVVGPKWPEGAHGHLVDRGHAVAGGGISRTQPVRFLKQAFDVSKRQQNAAVIRSLRSDVKEIPQR